MIPMTTQAIATTISSNKPVATVALSKPNLILGIEAKQRQPMAVMTSFISQQINIGLDDVMRRLSTQLVRIIKLMVENEVRNMHA